MPVESPRYAVLFCCMGNICRSPSAEGLFRAEARRQGLDAQLQVDSAGTHGYHAGEPPDARAQRHALRRGVDLGALRARQVEAADFERFDLIVAMDQDNLQWLREACPAPQQHKLRLMMSFAPRAGTEEVPDPYYGGAEGFERVLDLLDQACAGLLGHVQAELQMRRRALT
ncbi:MAG: low molecular weight phosphotyrosine protein phosphatase [Betaproteobacteria bacterium]|nr:low molecular weight phosphotyrosine protein phosphatase [Betaproteobacteria bacterium]